MVMKYRGVTWSVARQCVFRGCRMRERKNEKYWSGDREVEL